MSQVRELPEGITRVKVAKEARITRQTVWNWLCGRSVLPMTDQAIRQALARLKEQAQAA